jgi:PIN domain nuclease of toxin-antitoxin system
LTRLLLDTHVFMWWVEPTTPVPDLWVKAILDDANSVYVSAVVSWEIETKKRIGKLVFGHDVVSMTDALEFERLAITMEHSALAGSLDWDHRDPFDRILAAQAMASDLTLVTADAAMRSAPRVRVL